MQGQQQHTSPPPLISELDNDKDVQQQHQQHQQQQYQQQYQERSITIDLIRKRSEHNSNLISDLEEIALHQEELTSIGSTIGKVCGKTLRILLLQNNVISQLNVNEMKYFKVLEYLNLALNNITVVRGFNGFNGGAGSSVDTNTSNTIGRSEGETINSNTNRNIYNYNEHLSKIDLTLNFIDFDTLEESMDCLSTLRNLKELYMIGNPCCVTKTNTNAVDESLPSSSANNKEKGGNGTGTETDTTNTTVWKNFRLYVISKLSTLERLDGKEILRSERIKALQLQSKHKEELDVLAKQCKVRKEHQRQQQQQELKQKLESKPDSSNSSRSEIEIGQNEDDERTKHCPEDRIKLSNELYEQKKEKERNEKANQPKLKGEKEFEEDQRLTIEKEKGHDRDEKNNIKQCNEGKWDFTFDEETKPGYLTLDISIQRHLSSSLIDVDVHPTYISVVIKSKVLRLLLPIEVKAEQSTAKRSLTTGNLLIIMPKFNPKDQAFIVNKITKQQHSQSSGVIIKKKNTEENNAHDSNAQRVVRKNPSMGLQQELIQDAQTSLVGPVQLTNIVRERHDDMRCSKENEVSKKSIVVSDMIELSTTYMKSDIKKDKAYNTVCKGNGDEEEPPPMF